MMIRNMIGWLAAVLMVIGCGATPEDVADDGPELGQSAEALTIANTLPYGNNINSEDACWPNTGATCLVPVSKTVRYIDALPFGTDSNGITWTADFATAISRMQATLGSSWVVSEGGGDAGYTVKQHTCAAANVDPQSAYFGVPGCDGALGATSIGPIVGGTVNLIGNHYKHAKNCFTEFFPDKIMSALNRAGARGSEVINSTIVNIIYHEIGHCVGNGHATPGVMSPGSSFILSATPEFLNSDMAAATRAYIP